MSLVRKIPDSGPPRVNSRTKGKKTQKRIEAKVYVKLFRQEHGIALIVVMQFVLLKNVILIICSTITISFHLMEVKLKANVSRYGSDVSFESGLRGTRTVPD